MIFYQMFALVVRRVEMSSFGLLLMVNPAFTNCEATEFKTMLK